MKIFGRDERLRDAINRELDCIQEGDYVELIVSNSDEYGTHLVDKQIGKARKVRYATLFTMSASFDLELITTPGTIHVSWWSRENDYDPIRVTKPVRRSLSSNDYYTNSLNTYRFKKLDKLGVKEEIEAIRKLREERKEFEQKRKAEKDKAAELAAAKEANRKRKNDSISDQEIENLFSGLKP